MDLTIVEAMMKAWPLLISLRIAGPSIQPISSEMFYEMALAWPLLARLSLPTTVDVIPTEFTPPHARFMALERISVDIEGCDMEGMCGPEARTPRTTLGRRKKWTKAVFDGHHPRTGFEVSKLFCDIFGERIPACRIYQPRRPEESWHEVTMAFAALLKDHYDPKSNVPEALFIKCQAKRHDARQEADRFCALHEYRKVSDRVIYSIIGEDAFDASSKPPMSPDRDWEDLV